MLPVLFVFEAGAQRCAQCIREALDELDHVRATTEAHETHLEIAIIFQDR